MPTLKKSMFREYDVRGRESETELNETSIYHIARGFGAMLREQGVAEAVIGHDSRSTSESFHAAASRGLLESGINLTDIGTCTSPMSYWAQNHFNVKGLFMITASHNPAGWNGVKLGAGLGRTLLPDDIKLLYERIETEQYVDGGAKVRVESIKETYLNDLVSRAKLARPLRILLNTGNGTAGFFAPDLLRRFGCDVVEHFTAVDPSYPNYTPNPDGTAMMQDTGRRVLEERCDLGIAFDGDGDRLGITDERGETVWPDRYLILLSRAVLKKHPGAPIVFDVKVSEALPEDIAAHGGIPIMEKTGHSYIKSRRAKENAPLAGEMSGHIFYADGYYGFDDAFFACLKLLEYVSAQGKPLSRLIASTPYYVSTPTIQVTVGDDRKYGIVEELTNEFTAEGYTVVAISGARVYMKGGWGLVRASSNTPTLVLRFEAKTEERLREIRALFEEKLVAHGVSRDAWDTTGQ